MIARRYGLTSSDFENITVLPIKQLKYGYLVLEDGVPVPIYQGEWGPCCLLKKVGAAEKKKVYLAELIYLYVKGEDIPELHELYFKDCNIVNFELDNLDVRIPERDYKQYRKLSEFIEDYRVFEMEDESVPVTEVLKRIAEEAGVEIGIVRYCMKKLERFPRVEELQGKERFRQLSYTEQHALNEKYGRLVITENDPNYKKRREKAMKENKDLWILQIPTPFD